MYIGRHHSDRSGRVIAGSKWANPFRVKDSSSVEECINRFESYLLASPALMGSLDELYGKRLVCWCRRGAPCHADVIIKTIANKMTDDVVDTTLHIGVYASEIEFAEAAMALEHPFEAHFGAAALIGGLRFRMMAGTAGVVQMRSAASPAASSAVGVT